ncbi:MAG: sugar phosphate isomerase/epimerase [Clostridia bacterium]|nr:sugar phosphate isomerase/epimerase [Clostridia bacterium]
MRKSIQIGYDGLFALKCALAAKVGFKEISLNCSEVLDKSESEWEAIAEDIRAILEKNGLHCSQSHPYYYDLLLSSEITEERYEFAMKQAIITSAKLGAQWCVFHPRSSITSGFSVKRSLEDNKCRFGEYLELAVKHGTGIAAENLPVFDGIIPVMPFYSSNPEDLIALVDSFNDEKMAICWDFGHANLMCFDQAEKIREVGKRLQCTHVHNNFRVRDDHLTPDQGDIPWGKVMKAVREIGYTGALTLETHCRYDTPALLESFAKHNYACLEFLESLEE